MEKIKKFDEFVSTEANIGSFYLYLEYLAEVLVSPDLNLMELYEVLSGFKPDGDKLITNSFCSFTDNPKAIDKEPKGDDIDLIDIIEPVSLLVVEADEEKPVGCFSGILNIFRRNGKKWGGWFSKKKKEKTVRVFKETAV